MTQEQREHLATTIAILDMASAVLKDYKSSAADVVGAQCEIMQEVFELYRSTITGRPNMRGGK